MAGLFAVGSVLWKFRPWRRRVQKVPIKAEGAERGRSAYVDVGPGDASAAPTAARLRIGFLGLRRRGTSPIESRPRKIRKRRAERATETHRTADVALTPETAS